MILFRIWANLYVSHSRMGKIGYGVELRIRFVVSWRCRFLAEFRSEGILLGIFIRSGGTFVLTSGLGDWLE